MPDTSPKIHKLVDPETGQAVHLVYAIPPELLGGNEAGDQGLCTGEVVTIVDRAYALERKSGPRRAEISRGKDACPRQASPIVTASVAIGWKPSV